MRENLIIICTFSVILMATIMHYGAGCTEHRNIMRYKIDSTALKHGFDIKRTNWCYDVEGLKYKCE